MAGSGLLDRRPPRIAVPAPGTRHHRSWLPPTTRRPRQLDQGAGSEEQDDCLHLSVRDDGAGDADPVRGSGLIGLRDRVEALGGSFELSSPPGQGTLIGVQLPLRRH